MTTTTGNRSGTKEIEYWAACERARLEPEWKHSGLFAQIVSLTDTDCVGLSRARKLPTDIPKERLRYLAVECAFATLAASGAEGVWGAWAGEDGKCRLGKGEALMFDRFVITGRKAIRALCYHVYVERRRARDFGGAEFVYRPMASLGVSKDGFEKWLILRIRAVKEEIEAQRQ